MKTIRTLILSALVMLTMRSYSLAIDSNYKNVFIENSLEQYLIDIKNAIEDISVTLNISTDNFITVGVSTQQKTGGFGIFGNVGIGVSTGTSALDILNGSATIRGTNAGLAIRTLGTGTGTALVVDANGNILRDSSSKRYKKEIRDFKEGFHKILGARPMEYLIKNERQIGYIAEDFKELGLDSLIVYDNEGRPDAIKYDRIVLYLVEIIKDQQSRIQRLEDRSR